MVPPVCPGCSLFPETISFQNRLFRRGTIEVVNPNSDPNVDSGGGPFARGRVPASAMGVWRTPKNDEYANPEALVGRKVRVYFDGDCTYFEAQVTLTLPVTLAFTPSCLYVFCFSGLCRFSVPPSVVLWWLRLTPTVNDAADRNMFSPPAKARKSARFFAYISCSNLPELLLALGSCCHPNGQKVVGADRSVNIHR